MSATWLGWSETGSPILKIVIIKYATAATSMPRPILTGAFGSLPFFASHPNNAMLTGVNATTKQGLNCWNIGASIVTVSPPCFIYSTTRITAGTTISNIFFNLDLRDAFLVVISPQTPNTIKIHHTRFITLNSIPVTPVAWRDVNSSANHVRVSPFWWNAIQKNITTAKTRPKHIIRSFVSAGLISSTSSFFFVASLLSETSTCL